MGMVVVGAFVVGLAGMEAGALARGLLGRIRRGTRVRAPVCEWAVGVLWAVTGGLWGAGALAWNWLPALLGLAWLGVAAGLVDLRHCRLPDALTLPAAGVAPLALLPLGVGTVGRGLAGSVAAVVGYGAVHLALPTALGAGDVKLAASLGAVLGGVSWGALAVAAGLAAVGTAGIAVVAAGAEPPHRATGPPNDGAGLLRRAVVPPHRAAGPLRRAAGPLRRAVVPHGPSMLAASWLVTALAAVGAAAAPP